MDTHNTKAQVLIIILMAQYGLANDSSYKRYTYLII